MRDASQSDVERAAELLRAGEVVAFATETVYGLGGDARNPRAVARIYELKGRPSTNPLIVHVSDVTMARGYVSNWPAMAERMAKAFWPGPMTLVLPRGSLITPQVSAGLDTVGVRVPRHPVAQALLRAFDGPIAAPSANRSNRISPTTAAHVRDEFGDALPMILDGGSCEVGIESTVIDLTRSRPMILRPGSLTLEQIGAVIGDVEMAQTSRSVSQPASSPGQHLVHYSPRTPSFAFESGETSTLMQWLADRPAVAVGILLLEDSTTGEIAQVIHAAGGRIVRGSMKPDRYAHELYSQLRELDAIKLGAIWIELPPDRPEWRAVRDRLVRAVGGRIGDGAQLT